jgi:hypothetical protein
MARAMAHRLGRFLALHERLGSRARPTHRFFRSHDTAGPETVRAHPFQLNVRLRGMLVGEPAPAVDAARR